MTGDVVAAAAELNGLGAPLAAAAAALVAPATPPADSSGAVPKTPSE